MKKTGQILREARQAQGISIQEVSVHLKINNRILRALEEGDREQLPAKTFLRGFVRSYSQFLKLDENEILALFQSEMGTTHPNMVTKQVDIPKIESIEMIPLHQSSIGLGPDHATHQITSNQNGNLNASMNANVNGHSATSMEVSNPNKEIIGASSSENFPLQRVVASPTSGAAIGALSIDQRTWSKSMQIVTIGAVAVIGIVIYGVIKTIQKYERETLLVNQPSVEMEAVPRVTSSVDSPPPLTPVDESTQNSTPAPVTEAVESQSANQVGEVSTGSVPSKSQEIIVEALDRVVVEYIIDEKPKGSMVLNAEKIHTFLGDKQLSLWFSDGGTVNLIHNGKDRGVPGTLGQPLKLTFP